MTESTPAELRILHLSDTHLTGDGSLHYGIVDTQEHLERVLERASTLDDLDLVAVSGDLSEDGSIESYENLKRLIEPFAARRGAAVAFTMGNHDDRENFEAVLGPRTGVEVVHGFRIIRLDTSVPGQGFGLVDDAQLEWLRTELAGPSGRGTVLILHHPPIGAESALLAALELRNPSALTDACSGSDVRVVLCGHYHCATTSNAAGIPIFVAPGVANASDPLAPVGTERATFASGFSLVTIPLAGSPRVNFITVPVARDGEEIFSLDRATVDTIIKGFGPK